MKIWLPKSYIIHNNISAIINNLQKFEKYPQHAYNLCTRI